MLQPKLVPQSQDLRSLFQGPRDPRIGVCLMVQRPGPMGSWDGYLPVDVLGPGLVMAHWWVALQVPRSIQEVLASALVGGIESWAPLGHRAGF